MKQTFTSGAILRERRLSMGLTLLDVSRSLHVPANYIDALERGDMRLLPPACYTLGFLKSYCNLLGLDVTPFLQEYNDLRYPPRKSLFVETTIQKLFSKRKVTDAITWIAVCLLVAVCWIAYMVIVKPDVGNPRNQVEAGALEIKDPFPFTWSDSEP